jgi:hypothetical protein
MNDFLQDIWQDLREKRLLPVAALMLLGIVAIPVVLTESSAEPTPVVTQAPAEASGAAAVALDTEAAASSAAGSELDVFSSDDPFAPPKEVTRSKDTATAASAATADDKAGATGGGTGGGTAPGGSGGGGSEPLPPAPVPAPETSEYEYVADVTFWNGNRRSERRLRKLDMLPDQSAPALIFMGVTRDGGDAVFLVDATLSNTGEGSCRPGRQNCVYVAIGAGSEHLFTDPEGRTYRLRVDEIRRVKVKAAAADFGPEAQTATGSPSEARPFNLPSLVDLVVETSTPAPAPAERTDSSNEAEGR